MPPDTQTDRPRILIVEDDARLATLLGEYLSTQGFHIEVESRGDHAVKRIWVEDPALVILDLMLPGRSGFDICRHARERYSKGILILTASKAEVDQAVGLEIGADDYVSKPVDPRILLARIRSLLRRTSQPIASFPPEQTLTIGELSIDRARREVVVAGRTIDVTAVEFEVLWLLARQAGEVVSREELYLQVRGVPYDGLDRGMDIHVSRLRGKLDAGGLDPASLKAVRGAGYLLVKR